MDKNITNKKRLKLYTSKKIIWNPFLYLDRKAKKIPHFPNNVIFALIFFIASSFLLIEENQRINQRTLGVQTQLKADQETIYKWEQILTERPDYRDGWIQLAVVYYKLGDKEKAKQAIEKAKFIDPTNETILSFEKLLQDKE